jgi:hypothetical protein
MAVFEDAQDVYDTLGRLFAEIGEDDELYARFCTADTIVRYEYTDPEAAITVRLRCDEDPRVDFGDSDLEPEVFMRMSADTGHRFWLGGVNVTVALARGQITAEGPVAKILKLVPLTKPVFPRYKQQLLDQGRADLAEA